MGFETGNISDLMFYELIDKIVVYEAEGVSRARTQKVDIYFNYVGQVNIDYTPEEVAEIQAQEAQAAASALVALLLCPFAAPMLLSLAGSALIVAASALFAWLF